MEVPASPSSRRPSYADVVNPSGISSSPRALKNSFAHFLASSRVENAEPNTTGSHKGKPALKISDAVVSRLSTPYQFAMIGKFSPRMPSFKLIKPALQKIGFKGDFSVGALKIGYVFINFALEEDFARMWLKPEWIVEGWPMRVFKWTPAFNFSKESPLATTWIALHNLPIYLFDMGILFSIASLIGKPIRIDEPTADRTRPSVARVCVEIDLSKAQTSEVWLECGSTGGFWQPIVYENLPLYCNNCLHRGHEKSTCKAVNGGAFKENTEIPKEVRKTGVFGTKVPAVNKDQGLEAMTLGDGFLRPRKKAHFHKENSTEDKKKIVVTGILQKGKEVMQSTKDGPGSSAQKAEELGALSGCSAGFGQGAGLAAGSSSPCFTFNSGLKLNKESSKPTLDNSIGFEFFKPLLEGNSEAVKLSETGEIVQTEEDVVTNTGILEKAFVEQEGGKEPVCGDDSKLDLGPGISALSSPDAKVENEAYIQNTIFTDAKLVVQKKIKSLESLSSSEELEDREVESEVKTPGRRRGRKRKDKQNEENSSNNIPSRTSPRGNSFVSFCKDL